MKGLRRRVLSTGDSKGAPAYIQIANTWLLVNVGRADPRQADGNAQVADRRDQRLYDIRVADIQECYKLWKVEERSSLRNNTQNGETALHIRDPDGYSIEVGRAPICTYG